VLQQRTTGGWETLEVLGDETGDEVGNCEGGSGCDREQRSAGISMCRFSLVAYLHVPFVGPLRDGR